jgi:hypothetical protein
MKLCIESAQLYFNSSTSYHDSDMKLAQECLNIIDLNLKRKYYKQVDSQHHEGGGGLKFKSLFNQEVVSISDIKLINDLNITNLLPLYVQWKIVLILLSLYWKIIQMLIKIMKS